MEKDKVICEECAWKGTTNEILTAPTIGERRA